jgi:hypothetical protein
MNLAITKYNLEISHEFDNDKWKKSDYVFNSIKRKKLILVGINPAFSGTDISDITNLKIINTILATKEFQSFKGYTVYNLSNVQDKDSANILSSDCTDEHTKYVLSELKNLLESKHNLCLFYGPNFITSHKGIVRKYHEIFEYYLKIDRLFYMTDDEGFTHPRAFKGKLVILPVKNISDVVPPVKIKKKP